VGHERAPQRLRHREVCAHPADVRDALVLKRLLYFHFYTVYSFIICLFIIIKKLRDKYATELKQNKDRRGIEATTEED
jgi:hypothetical protein